MNQNTQIILNLKREILPFITLPERKERLSKLMDMAACAMSKPKSEKCDKCDSIFTCSTLTMWNDISDKELIRKG
jgi:hypothetical protein